MDKEDQIRVCKAVAKAAVDAGDSFLKSKLEGKAIMCEIIATIAERTAEELESNIPEGRAIWNRT